MASPADDARGQDSPPRKPCRAAVTIDVFVGDKDVRPTTASIQITAGQDYIFGRAPRPVVRSLLDLRAAPNSDAPAAIDPDSETHRPYSAATTATDSSQTPSARRKSILSSTSSSSTVSTAAAANVAAAAAAPTPTTSDPFLPHDSSRRFTILPPNLVTFSSSVVSRSHLAMFMVQDPEMPPKMAIQDLGSKHGTYLNDSRCVNTAYISPGDFVRLGQTTSRHGTTHVSPAFLVKRVDYYPDKPIAPRLLCPITPVLPPAEPSTDPSPEFSPTPGPTINLEPSRSTAIGPRTLGPLFDPPSPPALRNPFSASPFVRDFASSATPLAVSSSTSLPEPESNPWLSGVWLSPEPTGISSSQLPSFGNAGRIVQRLSRASLEDSPLGSPIAPSSSSMPKSASTSAPAPVCDLTDQSNVTQSKGDEQESGESSVHVEPVIERTSAAPIRLILSENTDPGYPTIKAGGINVKPTGGPNSHPVPPICAFTPISQPSVGKISPLDTPSLDCQAEPDASSKPDLHTSPKRPVSPSFFTTPKPSRSLIPTPLEPTRNSIMPFTREADSEKCTSIADLCRPPVVVMRYMRDSVLDNSASSSEAFSHSDSSESNGGGDDWLAGYSDGWDDQNDPFDDFDLDRDEDFDYLDGLSELDYSSDPVTDYRDSDGYESDVYPTDSGLSTAVTQQVGPERQAMSTEPPAAGVLPRTCLSEAGSSKDEPTEPVDAMAIKHVLTPRPVSPRPVQLLQSSPISRKRRFDEIGVESMVEPASASNSIPETSSSVAPFPAAPSTSTLFAPLATPETTPAKEATLSAPVVAATFELQPVDLATPVSSPESSKCRMSEPEPAGLPTEPAPVIDREPTCSEVAEPPAKRSRRVEPDGTGMAVPTWGQFIGRVAGPALAGMVIGSLSTIIGLSALPDMDVI